MKASGYQLREALKQWELRKEAASKMFDDCLNVFPGETKPTPAEVIQTYINAETAIAQIQTAQSRYNLMISFQFEGHTVTLAEAVKSLGGYARAEKLWRVAAVGKKDRYGSYTRDLERDPEKVYAQPAVSQAVALEKAMEYAKKASTLRAFIAESNAQIHDVGSLNPALL